MRNFRAIVIGIAAMAMSFTLTYRWMAVAQFIAGAFLFTVGIVCRPAKEPRGDDYRKIIHHYRKNPDA